jgi:hypothetical protein
MLVLPSPRENLPKGFLPKMRMWCQEKIKEKRPEMLQLRDIAACP